MGRMRGLVATLGLLSLPPLALAPRKYSKPTEVCRLKAPAITESSGMARSFARRGEYFTHNDSGDVARFFRFNTKGEITGEYNLKGAAALDWEDMAAARLGGQSSIYLGDIGDNPSKRKTITVYRVKEPTGGSEILTSYDTYTLTYPDGAHNCETLMVHPSTGDLWLVTKVNRGKSGVYALVAPRKSGDYTLRKVGDVEVGSIIPGSQMVTGGDISPDGRRVALVTYTAAYEFEVKGKFTDWFRQAATRIPIATREQVEAIGYSLDGRTLMTTSEGAQCPVDQMRAQ